MAISFLNSQGIQVYVVSPAATYADCGAARTAIKGGKKVGCLQSLGNLEETRNVTEYTCMDSNESLKALGAISRGNIVLGMLVDPADTTGQKTLVDAFNANTEVVIGIEYPDSATTPGDGDGTILYFTAGISGKSVQIEKDAAIALEITAEISSDITECAKA